MGLILQRLTVDFLNVMARLAEYEQDSSERGLILVYNLHLK
jgi:hypothetical protein